MRLLTYEGYNLTIDPMLLTLKPFKALWVRDKTDKKERAISEIAYRNHVPIAGIFETLEVIISIQQIEKKERDRLEKQKV